MSDIRIEPMVWRHQVWETVDGAAWFCDECGWAGLNHHSLEAAQSEANRHECKQPYVPPNRPADPPTPPPGRHQG